MPFERKSTTISPDASNYEVMDAKEENGHLVLKIKYLNCTNTSFDGTKVMVLLNCNMLKALKWKKVDPHFREAGRTVLSSEAPAPAARFPATPEGWTDAIVYARNKGRETK